MQKKILNSCLGCNIPVGRNSKRCHKCAGEFKAKTKEHECVCRICDIRFVTRRDAKYCSQKCAHQGHIGRKNSAVTKKLMSEANLKGSYGFKNGHIPWSKGQTKETNTSLMLLSEINKGKIVPQERRDKISKKLVGRRLAPEIGQKMSATRTGMKHSEARNKRSSEVRLGKPRPPIVAIKIRAWRRKFLLEGGEIFHGNGNYGFFADDLGHYVRSMWEANTARLLIYLNVSYEYEKHRFLLSTDTIYIPDFYIPSFDLFIEVKGSWRGILNLDKTNQFIEDGLGSMVVIDAAKYKEMNIHFKNVVPNWNYKPKKVETNVSQS